MMIVKVSAAVAAFFAAPVMAGSKHKGAKSVKISEHLSKEMSGKNAAVEVSSLGEIGRHDAALSPPKVGHHSHKKASFVQAVDAKCTEGMTELEKIYKDECKKADEIGTQADKDKYAKDAKAIKDAVEKDGNTALQCNKALTDGTNTVYVKGKTDSDALKEWCGKITKDNTMLYAGIAAVVVIGGGAAFYVSQQKGGGGEEAY